VAVLPQPASGVSDLKPSLMGKRKEVRLIVSIIRAHFRERGDPIKKERVQEYLNTEIDYSRLKLANGIYQHMTVDAGSIIKAGFSTSKVTAEEMLRPVRRLESPTSQQVTTETGYASDGAGLATTVLYRLSETKEKELWTAYPMLKMIKVAGQ